MIEIPGRKSSKLKPATCIHFSQSTFQFKLLSSSFLKVLFYWLNISMLFYLVCMPFSYMYEFSIFRKSFSKHNELLECYLFDISVLRIIHTHIYMYVSVYILLLLLKKLFLKLFTEMLKQTHKFTRH